MSAPDATTPDLLNRIPPPRRVAIVKSSRIGDFICATPAMRALRQALPAAAITLVTLPLLREIAVRLPYIDHVADFPGYPGIAEQLFDPRRATEFFRAMQAQGFDLALQLQGSGVNANPFSLMIGASVTAGFIRAGDGPGLLAAAIPLPESGHEIERMLALPIFLGAAPAGAVCAFPLRADDHTVAAELLAAVRRPLIGLNPGARDASRRWPVAHFAGAARHMQHTSGGSLVLLGEPDDPALQQLQSHLCDLPQLSLAGRTTLPVLGAVISRLNVLLTNDSGPAHIAYALATPCVTIFGPGDPAHYGPPAGPFRVVAHPSRNVHAVTVEQVISEARSIVDGAVRGEAANHTIYDPKEYR